MTGLSTHVLDLVSGQPAHGVAVRLEYDGSVASEYITDSDGRCAGLLKGASLLPGAYRLVFSVGAYFRRQGHVKDVDSPPFFDDVVVDFNITDSTRSYHVPLLVSPYGYSTYRGS